MIKTHQKQLEETLEVLEAQLAQSNLMWEAGMSPAYIVGYLQGVIKNTINELK